MVWRAVEATPDGGVIKTPAPCPLADESGDVLVAGSRADFESHEL